MEKKLTAEQTTPQCTTCRKSYDLAGWRELPILGVGTLGTTRNGKEMATGVTQTRRCECGTSVMRIAHFRDPVEPSSATVALVLERWTG